MGLQGVKRCLKRWGRVLAAELLATALLVWLGCASEVPVAGSVLLTQKALAFGLLVTANTCAFGEASGAHMNPAVTLGALLSGHMNALTAGLYVLAQLVGATLGYYVLLATTPSELTSGVGVTLPGGSVSPLCALFVEAAITAVLMLTFCSVWEAPTQDPAAPLKIGLVVSGLIFAAGPTTGAGLNPARSFGPAFLQGTWKNHWVYWAGPCGGSAVAVLLRRFVLTSQGFENVGTQI